MLVIGFLFIRILYILCVIFGLGIFMLLVVFFCVLMLISKIFLFKFVKYVFKFIVVVVLLMLFFWFVIEIICVMCVFLFYLIGCLFGNLGFLGYFLGVFFFF